MSGSTSCACTECCVRVRYPRCKHTDAYKAYNDNNNDNDNSMLGHSSYTERIPSVYQSQRKIHRADHRDSDVEVTMAGTACPATNGGYLGFSDAEVGASTFGPCGKITWKLFLKPLPAPDASNVNKRGHNLGNRRRCAYRKAQSFQRSRDSDGNDLGFDRCTHSCRSQT